MVTYMNPSQSQFSPELKPPVHNAKLILSVDDEELVLRLREKALEAAGYQVLSVSGGEQALNLFDDGLIDLVLLGRQMPGKDGVTVAREMKSRRPKVPIILVTGLPFEGETPPCLDAIHTKGDAPALLMTKIEQLFTSSMSTEQTDNRTGRANLEILGVYRPIVTKVLFEEQKKLYGNEHETREHFEKLVLIEAMVRGCADWDIDDFRQETPDYSCQIAYAAALLTTDGSRVIMQANDHIFGGRSILQRKGGFASDTVMRCAFFLHCYDPQLPVRWTHGEVQGPPPETITDRLRKMMPYSPAR